MEGAPRKLWRTQITIWTKWDPTTTPVARIVFESETGDGYMTRQQSELISDPYKQPDGPPEGFFGDES